MSTSPKPQRALHGDGSAPPPPPNKHRARLSDAEALDIALKYFNSPAQQPPLKLVGQSTASRDGIPEADLDKENQRAATRAWRALRQAFAHNLVAVIPTPRPRLDEKVGLRMREAFPNLLGVQVVILEDLSIKDERRLDDKIHEELGYAAAKWIAQGMLFQDHQVIGTGSGRAVYHAVRFLQEFPALTARDVTVMSLTGWVGAKNHAGNGGRDLEADTHAAMMVGCFSHPTIAHMVNHPIAHENLALREEIHSRSHLCESQWKEVHPRYALFGVGVLGPGHRLYETAKATKHEPTLEPLLEHLQELVAIGESVHARSKCPSYYPVADIANHLFCVRGRNWQAIDTETQAAIEVLVGQINAKLLTVNPAQLQSIENVILVAGTAQKTVAIRHLLGAKPSNVRFLCIDRETALKVLDKPYY